MTNSNGRFGSGTEAISFPEVTESGAAGQVAETLADIVATVRVPFAGLFWRVLAADPMVLTAVWAAVRPNLRTRAAELSAKRLRDHALIAEVAGIASHKAFKGDLVRAEVDWDLRTRINNFNHIARYALPKHLLAVTLVAELLAGRLPAGSTGGELTPTGPAPGAVSVSPVELSSARGRAASLLAEIAAAHGQPVPEDYYRSLARLPDYLAAAWNVLRPVVGDDQYQAHARSLVALAVEESGRLPLAPHLPAGALTPPQRDELIPVVAFFQQRVLPQTLTDCAIITALTDGPELRDHEPYAV